MSLSKLSDPRFKGAEARVTAVVSDHETRLDAEESATSDHEARITTLEGTTGSLAVAVTDLQDADSTLQLADIDLDTRLDVLEARSGLDLCFHALSSAQASWASMPAAATLLNGHHRHVLRANLTGFSQVRLHVNKMGTAGFAGSKLILRYATAFATSAGSYSDVGTSEVSCAIDATDTYVSSSWINLATLAKADVFLAIVGSGGNGATSPQYGSITAEVR